MSAYHTPVLLKESIDGLNIDPEGTYVDVTYGGGGHSKEILKKLKGGRLIAFDQDADSQKNIRNDERLIFVRQNFLYLRNNLRYLGITRLDGLLADLGVSSHQFDQAERGFSFRQDGPLDMRMNADAEFLAADLVNQYTTDELFRVFRELGEVRNAWKLVRLIETSRAKKEIVTIEDFLSIIQPCLPIKNDWKFLAKVFQALRIEVNHELDALKSLLEQSARVLKVTGRLVVISYHSLEDRLVKNYIKHGNFESVAKTDLYGRKYVPFKKINRKVMIPPQEEIKNNPRARSARLRIAERIEMPDQYERND
jgi:16S rRNA (cytosine1402-N4)-methyltransferase